MTRPPDPPDPGHYCAAIGPRGLVSAWWWALTPAGQGVSADIVREMQPRRAKVRGQDAFVSAPNHLRTRIVVVLASAALLITGVTLARGSSGQTASGPHVGSAPLPPDVAGASPNRSLAGNRNTGPGALSAADRAAIAADARAARPIDHPGTPVSLDIPIRTPNHPNGVHARVSADHFNGDGTLFVPSDPTMISWSRDDAKPGSGRGTTILTSHINYVINGKTVVGALSDLAVYARTSIGKVFTISVADGRVLKYRIEAAQEYTKDQLGADAALRKRLYDQGTVYGPVDRPSGRVLLVSCGGAFDNYTGEYQDNVFLYALPT